MAIIRFSCPQCQQPLQQLKAHEKVTCPKCSCHVRVPSPALQSTPYSPPPSAPNRQVSPVQQSAAAIGLPIAVPFLGNTPVGAALVPQTAGQPNGPHKGHAFWGWLGRHLIATFLGVISGVLASLTCFACLYYFTPLGARIGSVIDQVNSQNRPTITEPPLSKKNAADQAKNDHLIVGEWETMDPAAGRLEVLNFDKDGSLAFTSQGQRITGKYRIVGKQSVDMEFASSHFMNNISLAGTCTFAFPDNNRMTLTDPERGTTIDFRRVIR